MSKQCRTRTSVEHVPLRWPTITHKEFHQHLLGDTSILHVVHMQCIIQNDWQFATLSRINPQKQWVLPIPIICNHTRFHECFLKAFCVNLSMDKMMDTGENTNSLTKVTNSIICCDKISDNCSTFCVQADTVSVYGLTSHSTHNRSFRGRFLQAEWPNQQCQSTEGNQLVVKDQAWIPPEPLHNVTIIQL